MINKILNYIKKNKATIVILVISIICLIISLAVCCPIPGKLKVVSQENRYGENRTTFEYKYNGNKPLNNSLLAAACNTSGATTNTGAWVTYWTKGDTITVIVANWDGKSTVYLYYGDRVLAKS